MAQCAYQSQEDQGSTKQEQTVDFYLLAIPDRKRSAEGKERDRQPIPAAVRCRSSTQLGELERSQVEQRHHYGPCQGRGQPQGQFTGTKQSHPGLEDEMVERVGCPRIE